MGILMWANVWFVIWPKQKIVIANAVAMAGGAAANPAAAGGRAPRRDRLSYQLRLLHPDALLHGGRRATSTQINEEPTSAGVAAWLVVVGAIILVVELNALFGTTGPAKKPLDTIPAAITSAIRALAGDAHRDQDHRRMKPRSRAHQRRASMKFGMTAGVADAAPVTLRPWRPPRRGMP